MKAYAVTWTKMPQSRVIYIASTRGKATYAAYRSIRDYYTRFVQMTEFRTVRAPEYDAQAVQARYDGQCLESLAIVALNFDPYMPNEGYLP